MTESGRQLQFLSYIHTHYSLSLSDHALCLFLLQSLCPVVFYFADKHDSSAPHFLFVQAALLEPSVLLRDLAKIVCEYLPTLAQVRSLCVCDYVRKDRVLRVATVLLTHITLCLSQIQLDEYTESFTFASLSLPLPPSEVPSPAEATLQTGVIEDHFALRPS